MPDIEVYRLLVDCLRMRQEDVRHFKGEGMKGSIYGGEKTLTIAFGHFLGKAEEVKGLLPPWWTTTNVFQCQIQETWEDSYMPMKLRMLAQRGYGWVPFPDDGSILANGTKVEAEDGIDALV
ncbi:hypothetical protein B0A48_05697 [Cryoendolithus antarcticus]|uniref:Uncharacterized protein n=1 Tax=Cryoendolithus antarcticus TaxID=1507870 RepID=A0A1V8TBL2_9PEZI|nr:hypothetical protein B0A48_05697 [Cryoendolithus antarcticus]